VNRRSSRQIGLACHGSSLPRRPGGVRLPRRSGSTATTSEPPSDAALLTEALFAELRDTNVAVTVVFPGAIATAIAANSGVSLGTERATGETSAYKTTSPQKAAEVIVDAIRRGRFRATIGSDAAAMDKLSRLNPKMATTMIAKQMSGLLT
jgi:short-subunit dehydrogenase